MSSFAPAAADAAASRWTATEIPIRDFGAGHAPVIPDRPTVAGPDARARAVSKAPPGRIRARGTATWYCVAGVSACHRSAGSGMYAAAGPALRVGHWRGRRVTVCQGDDDCVRVKLIDWCACEDGRVVDLYGDAFRRLAPLSNGEIRVTVRW